MFNGLGPDQDRHYVVGPGFLVQTVCNGYHYQMTKIAASNISKEKVRLEIVQTV